MTTLAKMSRRPTTTAMPATMPGARLGMRNSPTAMSAPAASSQARVTGEKKAHSGLALVQ